MGSLISKTTRVEPKSKLEVLFGDILDEFLQDPKILKQLRKCGAIDSQGGLNDIGWSIFADAFLNETEEVVLLDQEIQKKICRYDTMKSYDRLKAIGMFVNIKKMCKYDKWLFDTSTPFEKVCFGFYHVEALCINNHCVVIFSKNPIIGELPKCSVCGENNIEIHNDMPIIHGLIDPYDPLT